MMNETEKLQTFLSEFEHCWQKVSFMRFGQLIENLSSFAKIKYDKKDLFYVENEELLNILKELVQHFE